MDNLSQGPFTNVATYAIKPDYQLRPEFVDLEIVEDGHFLEVLQSEKTVDLFMPYAFIYLYVLPSLPNFREFWIDNGDKIRKRRIVSFGVVAKRMSEGKKVFARFTS